MSFRKSVEVEVSTAECQYASTCQLVPTKPACQLLSELQTSMRSPINRNLSDVERRSRISYLKESSAYNKCPWYDRFFRVNAKNTT